MDAVIQECDCWPLSIGIGEPKIKYWSVQTKKLFQITLKTCKMGFEIAVFNKIRFVWQESLLTSLHPSLGSFLLSDPVIFDFFFIEIFTHRDSSVTVLQSVFKTKFVSEIFNMAKLINKTHHM